MCVHEQELKMRFWKTILVLGLVMGLAGVGLAQEHGAATSHVTNSNATHRATQGRAEASAVEGESSPPPVISQDGSWAGAMVIVILLGFFLPAWVIGLIVRAEAPEEVPPAHSHDEPPGASHHHGSSGTHTEEPHH
jgi:hypothetical protein